MSYIFNFILVFVFCCCLNCNGYKKDFSPQEPNIIQSENPNEDIRSQCGNIAQGTTTVLDHNGKKNNLPNILGFVPQVTHTSGPSMDASSGERGVPLSSGNTSGSGTNASSGERGVPLSSGNTSGSVPQALARSDEETNLSNITSGTSSKYSFLDSKNTPSLKRSSLASTKILSSENRETNPLKPSGPESKIFGTENIEDTLTNLSSLELKHSETDIFPVSGTETSILDSSKKPLSPHLKWKERQKKRNQKKQKNKLSKSELEERNKKELTDFENNFQATFQKIQALRNKSHQNLDKSDVEILIIFLIANIKKHLRRYQGISNKYKTEINKMVQRINKSSISDKDIRSLLKEMSLNKIVLIQEHTKKSENRLRSLAISILNEKNKE